MAAYNKLFAAIVSVLVTRWVLRYFGVDINEFGVGEDLRLAVTVGIDAAAAAVSGFFVWLIPNVKRAFG